MSKAQLLDPRDYKAIYLLRHAKQIPGTGADVWDPDAPLGDEGKMQAARMGGRLEGVPFVLWRTTWLVRGVMTAFAVQPNGLWLPDVRLSPAMDGNAWKDVFAKKPKTLADLREADKGLYIDHSLRVQEAINDAAASIDVGKAALLCGHNPMQTMGLEAMAPGFDIYEELGFNQIFEPAEVWVLLFDEDNTFVDADKF